jgi:hypothetical protein
MVKKAYPSTEAATFLVAEDVRVEQGGKLIAIGVYAGARIVMLKKPSASDPVKLRLVCFFAFQDGTGTFATRFALIGPNGEVIHEHTFDDSVKQPDRSLLLGVGAVFEIKELGDYKARVALDDHEYSYNVVFQDAPAEIAEEAVPKRRGSKKKRKAKER